MADLLLPPPPPLLPPKQICRPSLGRSGRRIEVISNHFSAFFSSTCDAVQYTISIVDGLTGSEICDKALNRIVISKLSEVYSTSDLDGKRFAYDGEKTLFTMGPLNFRNREFSVVVDDSFGRKKSSSTGGGKDAYSGGSDVATEVASKKQKVALRGREFLVKISHAADVKMAALIAQMQQKQVSSSSDRVQDATRVLDIVLRHHFATKGYLLVRDNFFSTVFGVADIGEGVQTCNGYHISFRPTLQGLSLNMNVATTTVFKACSLLEFIRSRFNASDLRAVDWNKAKKYVKGIKVENQETNVIHRITGFTQGSAADSTFMLRNRAGDAGDAGETEVTVSQYYETRYGKTLEHPGLPCIVAGSKKKPVFVPVELCHIVEGQRYTKMLTNSQRQKMIDQARRHPEMQKAALENAIDGIEFGSNPLLQEFGIKIDKRMRKVPARVLDAPTLVFGRNAEEKPNGGRWNFNNKVFVEPCSKIHSWVVLNFNPKMPPQAVNRSANDLAQACINKGLDMPRQPDVSIQEPYQSSANLPPCDRVKNMVMELKRRLPTRRPDFILCILPLRKTSDLYGPLKKLSETELNIVTQCIAPPHQAKDQYFTNVALKLNVKMGGMNSYLSMEYNRTLPKISQVPTIIFGMDVSHGAVGYSDSPSIAAVVASRRWPCISKYGVRLHAQSRKQEMISGLYEMVEENGESKAGGMIVELLREFYSSCMQAPDRRPSQVIVFRDGVSESQFEQTLRDEFLAFKQAFSSMPSIEGKEFNPKFTYIVVQKRHHTRLFPQGGSKSKSGNIDPGTIVDDGLCHPKDYDFFLCSQAGLIGTSRPAHYQVLVDENNFSVDELQMIVHSLCYTYARSTTAVSTVAPVAYAHLAAMHARNFLDSETGSETSSMASMTTAELSERVKKLPELHADMKKRMFFC